MRLDKHKVLTCENTEEEGVARSDLPPSGFTHTVSALHTWCGSQVHRIRETFNDDMTTTETKLWSYRYKGNAFLSLDFLSLDKHDYVVFVCSGENSYQNDNDKEIEVMDMTEALHASGIILQALGVENIKIGRTQNEVNPDVVRIPFEKDQTNGKIYCWKENKDRQK